jgi:hypothetical protein
LSPVGSSIDAPTIPVAPARQIVSATASGDRPKPFLEVRRDRQIGRRRDFARVRERLVARQLAVLPAEDAGCGAARGRERLEAEPLEQLRRAGVECVGDDERTRSRVQRPQALGFVGGGGGHDGDVACGCRASRGSIASGPGPSVRQSCPDRTQVPFD